MSNLSPRRRLPLPQASLRSRQARRMAGLRVAKQARRKPVLAKLHSFAVWDGWTKLIGLVALLGLLFTQQSVVVSQKQLDLTELGQVNDRINKSAEQLVSKDLLTRIAAVESLNATAARWPDQKQAVDVILSAFVASGLSPGTFCAEITAPDAKRAVGVILDDRGERFPIKSLPAPYSGNVIVAVDRSPESKGPFIVNFPAFVAAREPISAELIIGEPTPDFCTTESVDSSGRFIRRWSLPIH